MMGAANAELWNNLGLCCFYASQYDMIFRCFENALLVADDMAQADVWCARRPPSAHSGGLAPVGQHLAEARSAVQF